MSIQETATNILLLLDKMRATNPDSPQVTGPALQEISGLPPHEINDALALLEHSGYVGMQRFIGTAPFSFGYVGITPLGRYEAERAAAENSDANRISNQGKELGNPKQQVILPPAPIGSPYGFQDVDWEVIADRKAKADSLIVVMGYQFKSSHYDTKLLQQNIETGFKTAVAEYNRQLGALRTELDFRPLAAGYGEHLFNEIARDIIASDIAVFETSDLNPNVMLELGVALTWGIRVLPIKIASQPKPPSDISGQTWADYVDNGMQFLDPEHERKLIRMVERAMRKKSHG